MMTAIGSGQIIARTGRYKIFMQVGIVLATVMVFGLSTLTSERPYLYEAAIMFFLGAGLGVVMPIMNLAVQNEFAQHELGVATSSSQLFRSLGSTVGIAVFGAMLTAGLTSHLAGVQNDSYVNMLKHSPEASKIGELSDTNTLLNLNMPDVKERITDGFEKSLSSDQASPTVKNKTVEAFRTEQSAYGSKVTHAFSDSLQRIFIVSSALMLAAAVLVFMVKEKQLKSASPDETPGLA